MTTIDCRCKCAKCRARTEDIYRMIGRCANCGTTPILLLFRAGDPIYPADCPVCGNWHSVHTLRLATADEIPAAPDAVDPVDRAGQKDATRA